MTRKKCQWCRWRDAFPNRLRCFDGIERYMCEICWAVTKRSVEPASEVAQARNGSADGAETVVQVDDDET